MLITRHRIVMHRSLMAPPAGLVAYETLEDERVPRRIMLHEDTVTEMGYPARITVTVEPGDLLND